MKKILKYFSIFDIIIAVLFIVITVLSILLFKWLGLIAIPIMGVFIFIYYNSNDIADIIKILIKKIKKKESKKDKVNIDSEDTDDIILKDLYETKEVEMMKKVKNKKSNVKSKKSNVKGKKNTKKYKDKKEKKVLKVILSIFLIFGICCVLLVAAFMAYIVITTEDFDPDKLTYRDQSLVYDKNNVVFATLATEKRESVTYDQLPEVLIDAIIATEDSRFFQHNGVDFARFLKASFGQLFGNSDAGGASTLTMQVSKNNLTSTKSSGIEGIIRKFRDLYISVFQIEKQYTKEQIIEFYVNDNLLGGSNYGVEQASQYYFGKSVSELNLAEAATIAGIFQAPNKYRPDLHPDDSEERRATVLNLMVRHGYITKEEADATKAIPVSSLIVAQAETESYQGYIDTVIEEIENKLGVSPYEVSMKIYTSLDTSIQDGIDNIMSGATYTWENDVVQAGIAVIDVNTGEVVAIGAGRNKSDARTFNYATQARKHPGSTAKPLFDYGPGFEYSNYSTYTLFNDEPWTYTNGPSVSNWDGGFQGLLTLRQALAVSRNIPALKAFQQNDKSKIRSFVESLGIKPEETLHEAHAIGGFTGVTPYEMAAAYAAFANGGYYIEPHTVTKIEYRDTGEIQEFKYTKERVMEASTAFMINNILQYAVETGSHGGASAPGKTVAAKTGTSSFSEETIAKYGLVNDPVNDLWTCAYTPEYSFSLWYGYDELTSEYYNHNGYPYKNNLMSQLVKVVPMTTKQFEIPDTVVQSQVEFGTWPAKLPSENTPADLIRTEYFKKGTQPTEVSSRFQTFSDVTNLKTTKVDDNTVKLSWSYTMPEEFTKTYLNKYFSQSVFGNGTSTFATDRYNSYGGLGFQIYLQDENNNLTKAETFFDSDGNSVNGFIPADDNTTSYSIEFTNTSSKNVHLIVKVQYKDYDANASKGVTSSSLVNGGGNVNNNLTYSQLLKVSNIDSSITTTIGNFELPSDINVEYNKRDVTTKSVITYTLNDDNYITNDEEDFTDHINDLEAGTYTITYKINYSTYYTTFTQTLILKES